VVVRTVVVVAGRVVLVVVGGGQAPRRGTHVSRNRSRSAARPPRAVTCTLSVPGRWRSSGPRTGTISAVDGPHAGPASDPGTGRRPRRTRRLRSVGRGRHPSTPSSFTQRRAVKRHVPSQRPSLSQVGSPSTHSTRRGPCSGNGLSTSSTA
jgi:hypothetical protein